MLGGQILQKDYYGNGYKKGNLDYLNELHLKPVGAGPFRFVEYLPGQEIRFEANEHFYNGKPEVAQFIYKTIEGGLPTVLPNGELDYSALARESGQL